MATCWVDGKFVAEDEAKVSVFDHGLLYGDGVFEGIRFYNYQPFRLHKHLQRLFDSAIAIDLTITHSITELEQIVLQLIERFPKAEGYIRLVVTRGKGSLGINPTSCEKPTIFMIADEQGFINQKIKEKGANIIIASTRRISADALDPKVKSLNYLNNIMAKIEANHANADEAILLNAQGKVTEGSTDNVFIVKNNVLLTPPVSDGALDGITREIILEIAAEVGITCYEKSLSAYDLYSADECFLTGTAIELIFVREIDGRKMPINSRPIFNQLSALFAQKINSDGALSEDKMLIAPSARHSGQAKREPESII